MLEVCPDCSYSLQGLSEEGRCPECGFSYDRELIVVYGFSQGDPAGHAMRDRRYTRRQLVSGGISLALMLPIFWCLHVSTFVLVMCVFGGVISTIYILTRARRLSTQGISAPIQLRMSREGYAQREGVGPVKLTPWPARLGAEWRLLFRPGHRNRYAFQLAHYVGPMVLRYGFNLELDWPYDDVVALHDRVVRLVESSTKNVGWAPPTDGDPEIRS